MSKHYKLRSPGGAPITRQSRLLVTTAYNTLRISLLGGLALLLAACASAPPKPDVDYKQDYDFSQVRSVAFLESSGSVAGDNPLQLSDMQKDRVDTAIRHALSLKGITLVDDIAEADMLISWHLLTQFKTDVQTYDSPGYMGMYYGYNRYSLYNCWSCMGRSTDVSVRDYTEGTFIVDMIDPKLERSVWRGVTHSRLTGKQLQDQARYNEAAEVIFAAFPPGLETVTENQHQGYSGQAPCGSIERFVGLCYSPRPLAGWGPRAPNHCMHQFSARSSAG